MSTYNPDNPILFLTGTISSTTVDTRYEYDDITGLGPSGTNIGVKFLMTVDGISNQLVGSNETRTGASRRYDGLDIKTGDWVADKTGNKCLQITSIQSKSTTSVTFIAEDVDAYTYKNYRSNQFAENVTICFFEITDSGLPMIAGPDVTTFWTDKVAIDKIQTRFELQNNDERFKFRFSAPQTSVDVGDICTIDVNGNMVKFESVGANSTKIGVVMHKSYGDTIVYVKPYNNIISNYKKPEDLTGSVGDVYYASTSNPGGITTDSLQGSDRIFMQVTEAVPTIVEITSANPAIEASKTLVINGETVTTGPTDTDTLVNDINSGTSVHYVAATSVSPVVSTTSQDALSTANGDVVFVISSNGGSTFTYPSVTISDGTNSSTVSFQTSDSTYPPNALYVTVSATQMADDLNTAFTADGVNIVASTADASSTSPPVNNPSTYPLLVLTSTQAGFDITITNVNSDVFGQSFQDATAVQSVTGSTDKFVTLTRQDGGDIFIEGTSSTINQNGLVSSSNGDPAFLLMIEDEEGAGTTTVGVATDDDLDQVPNVTSSDGDATGVFITHTPFGDGLVQVTVNGLSSNIGDGVTTLSCYFSADGGTTARNIADIEGGDQLYWNGSIAGYELDGTDLVDVIYDKPSA